MDYVKVGGSWKKATDSFIKVNGHWEKAVGEYVKVGGHWSDASNLAATKLSYDGTTETDTDGTRYLVNSVEPTTHKAPLHSGTAITLSGDGKIEVPINLNPPELFTDLNPGYVENGHCNLVLAGTAKTTNWIYVKNISKLHLNIIGNTRSVPQVHMHKSLSCANHPELKPNDVEVGDMVYVVPTGAEKVRFYLSNKAPYPTHISITDVDYVPVQGTTYVFDHKTKTFTPPTLPLAPTYTLKDGTYGTIIKLDTNTFSKADLDAFTARPELVLEWVAGTATIPSAIVKGTRDEIVTPTITGTHTITNTSQFGIQQIKVGAGAMNGKDDGRYIDIPMVGGHKHLLKTCVKLIAGDITQVVDTPC